MPYIPPVIRAAALNHDNLTWSGATRMTREEGSYAQHVTNQPSTRTQLLKQLVRWKNIDVPGKDGLRFIVSSALPMTGFASFIQDNSEKDVVGFFREITHEIEEVRGLLDYHLKVRGPARGQQNWFCVEMNYNGANERKLAGEALSEFAPELSCTWCNHRAPLNPGQEPGREPTVTAAECVLGEFSDQPHVQCALHPHARPGFVVFPVRHVEKMSDLQDEELFALWSTAVRALQQNPFRSMVLNHGTYKSTRNNSHMLLKVFVDDLLHEQERLRWSSERLDVWDRLRNSRLDNRGKSAEKICERICCKPGCRDILGQDGLRFVVPATLPWTTFCSFIQRTSQENVVDFFREILREVEDKRGLLDYHMRIRDSHNHFCAEIFYGDTERKFSGEALDSGECGSCFSGAPLYPGQEPGVTAGDLVLTEFSDQPHVQCSLHPKARAGFVVTPVRHVERMSQLQDEELFSLWSTAVRALQENSLPGFKSMTLNHGTYRNTGTHLLLKVSVDELLHEQLRLNWTSEKLDLWNRLLALAENEPLNF